MERNESFAVDKLSDLAVRLAWAQVEIFTDEINRVQVLAAGDENSVRDLRIAVDENGVLEVEQPQYGIVLNITESHWMQVCVRLPKTWDKKIQVNTVSGLLNARGLVGSRVALDTVSGDVHASHTAAADMLFKSVSGDIHADGVTGDYLAARSLSGSLTLDGVNVKNGKFTTVNGEQKIRLIGSFKQMDLRTVSGDATLQSPVETMNVAMRSISGHVVTQGVTLTEDASAPQLRATGVSADLKLICEKE